LQGDKGTALSRPDGALITEELAMKYFGTANAIGKTITIANKASFMVSGILKNLPTNTDRKQQLYLPYLALKTLQPWMISEECVNVSANRHCFILLKPGVSPSQLNLVLPSFVHKYYSDKDAKEWQFQLQPLTDIHLNTVYGASVSKNDLVALGCIGLFLVLAACINFINLATAQATSRTKEIGVRKVLGGTGPQLFWQSIVETTSIAVLSLMAALVLAEIALPYVNQLFHTQIHINLMKDVWMSGFLVLLLVFIVFSSGIYPGLLMAGIQPVLALKGKISRQLRFGCVKKRTRRYTVCDLSATYHRHDRDRKPDALFAASRYGFQERWDCHSSHSRQSTWENPNLEGAIFKSSRCPGYEPLLCATGT
jgi:putative ABC transport system permease protein